MIGKPEIIRIAGQLNLNPHIVEKDYALGWLLAGIFANEKIGDSWVFKGDTCLKKCFFETYRFSEDLDFNPRGRKNCQGKISYRGPVSPTTGGWPRIKLDLTADERLVLPPVRVPIFHPYSDAPDGDIIVQAYAYEEAFGEKVRALAERTRPRDLYDVINPYRNTEARATPSVLLDVLRQKCQFKGIAIPKATDLDPFENKLEAGWEHMLRHQTTGASARGILLGCPAGILRLVRERSRPGDSGVLCSRSRRNDPARAHAPPADRTRPAVPSRSYPLCRREPALRRSRLSGQHATHRTLFVATYEG